MLHRRASARAVALWLRSAIMRLFLAVIVVPALVMVYTGSAHAASKSPCGIIPDKDHHHPDNTHIDDFGTLELSGANWLNGNGVDVCSNIKADYSSGQNQYVPVNGQQVLSGEKWQCVELVNRLYLARGWITSHWQGDGSTLKDHVPKGLVKQNNGSITYLLPGDVVTFTTPLFSAGHAAIVSSIDGSKVTIVNQNTTSVFSTATLHGRKLTFTAWGKNWKVQAVIHRPFTKDEPPYYANKIVQSTADKQAQKTSWYVSPDLNRYWIPDTSTYVCLRRLRIVDAGPISPTLLSHLPLQTNSIQLCGTMQPHGTQTGTPTPTATNTPSITPTVTPTPTPTHAPSYYANKIVQWDGDTATQKTSWLVNHELTRYLIPDSSTFDCLKSSGFAFGGAISKTVLDQLPVKNGNSAACGKNALYANQRLFRGAYLRTSDGNYTLKLQNDGNLVLRSSSGAVVWANGKTSDYLVMQGDGNLVTYRFGGTSTWATNTVGTGATKLAVQNGGKLVLYSSSGAAVWDSVHGKL